MINRLIMKLLTTLLFLFFAIGLFAQQADNKYFELRIYYCHPGQRDALVDRFEKQTVRIFEKHGMENIGYWVPVSGEQNMLYYILAFPSKDAREKSWAAFDDDAEWKAIKAQSNETMVDSAVSVFMSQSDILPKITVLRQAERVFELRTYTCLPGRLPNLITRFKDHTLKLFQKHGMESIVYFTTLENGGIQPKLIYLLGHAGMAAADRAWKDFRADPEWTSARDASEKDGKIVGKVESVFLKPLRFSKIR